jgi:hypothetical protein
VPARGRRPQGRLVHLVGRCAAYTVPPQWRRVLPGPLSRLPGTVCHVPVLPINSTGKLHNEDPSPGLAWSSGEALRLASRGSQAAFGGNPSGGDGVDE